MRSCTSAGIGRLAVLGGVVAVVACGTAKEGQGVSSSSGSSGPGAGAQSGSATSNTPSGSSGSNGGSASASTPGVGDSGAGATGVAAGSSPSGATSSIPFAGSGMGGQSSIISNGISPMSCGVSSAFNGTTITVVGGDYLTCYYSASVSPTLPLGFIEQDEEIIGDKDLIHVRLTLNPAFVDNTYGSTAIGWGGTDAGLAGGASKGPSPHGHTFWDSRRQRPL